MYAAEEANAERLVDLSTPLKEDLSLQLLTEKDAEALKVVRHSAAHVMATAVLELYPETKLGHGPATDAGFFYDFYRPTPFTPEDLKAIEARMAEVVKRNEPFVREWEPRDQSLARFKAGNDFMKAHFVERFTKPGEEISFYRNGAFEDFCRGPHVPSTGRVKAYKVMNLAGAYWLGDEHNPQLQRIYGTAFFSAKEMEQHFARLEEAQRRDHRVLGKQLDLFSIQEVAGPGLIFWHPKGAMVRRIMEDWMRDECLRHGYELVYTPHVARVNLWQISGHEGFYSQNMFTPMELDDADYRMKPMNCPFHILIYKNSPKSYRDLPVRYAELGNVYRYERSGTMHGLLRVRGFTQDDAHIFCTPAQIEDEVVGCIEFAQLVLNTFGFAEFKVELSTWDPKDRKSYTGSDENWALAIHSLENALARKGIPYKTILGEAAFYGPKIDIKLVDVLGRLWQLSTVQFDFNMPARFEMEYVGEDGERHQPRDGPSCTLWVSGAVFWGAGGALCRRLPALAGAGAGGDCAHQRASSGLREKDTDDVTERRFASRDRSPQRKNGSQDSRLHLAEAALHPCRRRQRIRDGSRQPAGSGPGRQRQHAAGGLRYPGAGAGRHQVNQSLTATVPNRPDFVFPSRSSLPSGNNSRKGTGSMSQRT